MNVASFFHELQALRQELKRTLQVALLGNGPSHAMEGGCLAPNIADFFLELEGLCPELKRSRHVALLGNDASHVVESGGLPLKVADCFLELEGLCPELKRSWHVALLGKELREVIQSRGVLFGYIWRLRCIELWALLDGFLVVLLGLANLPEHVLRPRKRVEHSVVITQA